MRGSMNTPRRRQTIPVRVRGVTIGGGHPVAVQSMTNTDTADVESTAKQVAELFLAGSELVRITVNNRDAQVEGCMDRTEIGHRLTQHPL